MGRPKGGTNKSHSKEEKLALVKRNLSGEMATALARETGLSDSMICKWTKQYLEGGEAALVNKRKPGNPLAKYARKKGKFIILRAKSLFFGFVFLFFKLFFTLFSFFFW